MAFHLINPTPYTGWNVGDYCFYYDPSREYLVHAKVTGVNHEIGMHPNTVIQRFLEIGETVYVKGIPFNELFAVSEDALRIL